MAGTLEYVMREVQNVLVRMFGFCVRIQWDGREFEHWSITEQDALEWMKCYPHNAVVSVWFRNKEIMYRKCV